jgi:hypothetical protein
MLRTFIPERLESIRGRQTTEPASTEEGPMRASAPRVLLLALCALALTVVPGSARSASAEGRIDLSPDADTVELLHSNDSGLAVSYTFSGMEHFDVQTERGAFTHISMPGLSHSTQIGHPKLPVCRRVIAVPLDATVSAHVVHDATEELALSEHGIASPVMPAQPPHPKNLPASAVPFAYDPASYAVQGYGDRPVVHVEELGILRGLRLFLLVVEPVRYDPTRRTLLVHTELNVEVEFHGGNPEATRDLRRRTWSPYFESVYGMAVLNHEPRDSKDDLTRYPVKYVIVSDPMFTSQLQPFIEWKTQKGFDVIVGYIGDPAVGSTTNSIKSYLQGLYDAGTPEDPAPSFVLFVGDVDQVPAWNGTTGQHVTDVYYATLAGGDLMPEVYYGRFSANSTAELQPQIDKTLEYERYEMPDPSFLGEAVLIAGMDTQHGQTWANGQVNYGTTYYFNAAHGIVSHTYLYPGSGSQAADIISDVSNGVGYANYTAHGYEYGWADPAFTVSDIQTLANAHMYPTAVGNCCCSNSFNYTTCFGEAWLRAEDKGAIGYIGAANLSYWDEDYWWGVGAGSVVENPTYESTGAGAYDGMFHDHGEPFPQWYTAQYAFNMAGNLAIVEAGSWAIDYYWEIYALMGDPSLSTYFGVPATNAVGYPGQITMGETSLAVSADPWSYVGLSLDGQLYAAALVDETGQATLDFDAFSSPGDASLVITRQNREPVIATVQIIPASGPYIITANVSIDDTTGGNGNGQVDFAEVLGITLTEENIGTETAYGVDVRISTTDPYLAVTDSTEHYGDIAAGQQVTMQNGFAATVAADVPDNHSIAVNVTATDNAANQWNDSFTIVAYAPMVSIATVTVDDTGGNGDGLLDPGEVATLDLGIGNTGGAPVANVVAVLSSADPYVTIADDTESLGSLDAGDTLVASYDITVDAATPAGHVLSFELAMAGDDYATADTFSLPVGIFVEGFETGDFSSYPWTMGGDAPWAITSTDPHEGMYCAASGGITHDQTSEISVSLQVLQGGDITFYYKVSSEDNYDYLRFYIDGVQQREWSGEVDWTEASFPVTEGSRTFSWRYEKDGSVSDGDDRAWLDYVVFPLLGDIADPDVDLSPTSFDVSVTAGDTQTEHLTIANSGEGNLTYTISVTTQAKDAFPGPALKLDKGESDPRVGDAPLSGSGGPDAFGYTWIDSDEPGGPVYDWFDISTMGTSPGSDDDGNYGPIDIGFSFLFYGNTHTTLQICTNGWLSFTSSSTEYTNEQIPNGADPNDLIAPFWDDLNPTDGGAIYYYGDQANDRFIVQWDQVPHYYDPPDTGTYTFQAILYEDGRIVYQYNSLVGSLTSCTVGIENADGTDGLEVVFNQAYLHDGMAILFEASQPWLTVTPSSGTVEPDSADVVDVVLNAAALGEGTYTGTITVDSNDPDEPSLDVPVVLHVTGYAADEDYVLPTQLALDLTPNPFSTTCRIASGPLCAHLREVGVFDLKGNLVWRHQGPQLVTRGPIVWAPAPSVGNGVYVVRAALSDRVLTRKVVYVR